MNKRQWIALLMIVGWLMTGRTAGARMRAVVGGAGGGKGAVTLPYRLGNINGTDWVVNQGGWLRAQSNMPFLNQGALLSIDGTNPTQNNNQARVDEAGELVIDNLQCPNMIVTRHIAINKETGYVRIIDVLKNSSGQQVDCQYELANSIPYGVQATHPLSTKYKGKEVQTGAIVQDGQNRQIMGIFGGRNGKVQPLISADQNNNNLGATLTLSILPNKELAVMSVLAFPGSVEAGDKLAEQLRDAKVLTDVPRELRKILANFSPSHSVIGGVYGVVLGDDLELLRGDLFDCVELRGGDQYKGTIAGSNLKLQTSYGPVSLPTEKILTVFTIGSVHPRQLVVLEDGSIYGGQVELEKVSLTLTSGQVIQLPMSQVTRIGYHARSAEDASDDWNFDQPMVFLRAGDRFPVGLLAHDISVATRYGLLTLKPQMVGSISFANEESGVHQFTLVDGTKFAGLLVGDSLELSVPQMAATAPSSSAPSLPLRTVKFALANLARVQFHPISDIDETSAVLKLSNEDQLVGTLTGVLKLDTMFDTLSLKGEQIKTLKPSRRTPMDVQIRLWDDGQVSGQLQNDAVTCLLGCGLEIKASLLLIEEYNRPCPEPSDQILQRIRQVVTDLNADDWKVRDRAQAQLTAMGSVVTGVLKEMREAQPTEAKRRIDEIIAATKPKESTVPAAVPAQIVPMMPNAQPIHEIGD